ncbi:hypothetical protein AAIH70_18905 [Neorhizobium sp. BT27B]|uniref:hypothetical protein n=1 Tax=Neorhizobium sp. BT27B TaxID=3142625 RepID=UPI003D288841
MSIVTLARGMEYPLPIRAHEGAAAHFLTDGGNILQVAMTNVTRSEARSIRSGPMKAGIIVDGSLIFWVFEFGMLIFDAPFDARIVPPEARWLPDIKSNQQRLAIEVHLVETSTMIVRGIRYVTLSPELTRRFLLAVQDQLADNRDATPYLTRWNGIPITRLPTLARVERCGA